MTVDLRGPSCPRPVMETKRALEQPRVEETQALLDDWGSKKNGQRFAENQNTVLA